MVRNLSACVTFSLHFKKKKKNREETFDFNISHRVNSRHNSVRSAVAVQSDILPFVDHLLEQLNGQNYQLDNNNDWWKALKQKCATNQKAVQSFAKNISTPLNYYAVFHHMQEIIPRDAIIVSEGANTMDIGRSMLLNQYPKHRYVCGHLFLNAPLQVVFLLCVADSMLVHSARW